MQKFERQEIPGKVRDIKLNKYYKNFTILVIANEFGCITRSITVYSSVLGQNSQLSLDKTSFEHLFLIFLGRNSRMQCMHACRFFHVCLEVPFLGEVVVIVIVIVVTG